jgi:hypothetical protein
VSRLRSYELRRGKQVSENREPQNTEQGIMNVEGKENFIIRNSLFDIQNKKMTGLSFLVSSLCHMNAVL